MTRSPAKRRSEDVTSGHIVIGRIVQCDRGFECFGPDGKYWFCDPTLAGARKSIFERHRLAARGAVVMNVRDDTPTGADVYTVVSP